MEKIMPMPDIKLAQLSKHCEIHVRTLGAKFLARAYLVEYDTEKKESVQIIGRIIRGGKKIGDFRKKEYPNEAACSYGYMAPSGILFVYKRVTFVESDRLLAAMNGKEGSIQRNLLAKEPSF